MDISLVTVMIYFVGIAAVVNEHPQNYVKKAVIFPEAGEGGEYLGTRLIPHQASLNLRTRDIVADTPEDFCDRIGGKLNPNKTICSVPLSGARLSAPTAEAATEHVSFRKIPSFINFNRNARNLPEPYQGVDPEYVAARFDITGGRIRGCNKGLQFIPFLITNGDGVIYLDQDRRTVRIVLKNNSVVSVENKPKHSADLSTSEMSHFGWYFAMNSRIEPGEIAPADPLNAPETGVTAPPCASIPDPDADPNSAGTEAAASAECSAVFFP